MSQCMMRVSRPWRYTETSCYRSHFWTSSLLAISDVNCLPWRCCPQICTCKSPWDQNGSCMVGTEHIPNARCSARQWWLEHYTDTIFMQNQYSLVSRPGLQHWIASLRYCNVTWSATAQSHHRVWNQWEWSCQCPKNLLLPPFQCSQLSWTAFQAKWNASIPWIPPSSLDCSGQ